MNKRAQVKHLNCDCTAADTDTDLHIQIQIYSNYRARRYLWDINCNCARLQRLTQLQFPLPCSDFLQFPRTHSIRVSTCEIIKNQSAAFQEWGDKVSNEFRRQSARYTDVYLYLCIFPGGLTSAASNVRGYFFIRSEWITFMLDWIELMPWHNSSAKCKMYLEKRVLAFVNWVVAAVVVGGFV